MKRIEAAEKSDVITVLGKGVDITELEHLMFNTNEETGSQLLTRNSPSARYINDSIRTDRPLSISGLDCMSSVPHPCTPI